MKHGNVKTLLSFCIGRSHEMGRIILFFETSQILSHDEMGHFLLLLPQLRQDDHAFKYCVRHLVHIYILPWHSILSGART